MGASWNKKIRLDMRECFSSVRRVEHGNRLLVLEFFQAQLDKSPEQPGPVLQLVLL